VSAVTLDLDQRPGQPPVPAPSLVAEWRMLLPAYLADPDLQGRPVPRDAIQWFLWVASEQDHKDILAAAALHAGAVMARRYTDSGVQPPAADRVAGGGGWLAEAMGMWDITDVTTPDLDTVTVTLTRRQP
jgi:hypothetical protein